MAFRCFSNLTTQQGQGSSSPKSDGPPHVALLETGEDVSEQEQHPSNNTLVTPVLGPTSSVSRVRIARSLHKRASSRSRAQGEQRAGAHAVQAPASSSLSQVPQHRIIRPHPRDNINKPIGGGVTNNPMVTQLLHSTTATPFPNQLNQENTIHYNHNHNHNKRSTYQFVKGPKAAASTATMPTITTANTTIPTTNPCTPPRSKGKPTNDETEQALVARARFEMACQLLHKQILEKEHRLTVSELSFLNRLLLDDNDDDGDDHSNDVAQDNHQHADNNELLEREKRHAVMSATTSGTNTTPKEIVITNVVQRISAIESSLQNLQEDPLFTTPPTSPDKNLPTPQRKAFQQRSGERGRESRSFSSPQSPTIQEQTNPRVGSTNDQLQNNNDDELSSYSTITANNNTTMMEVLSTESSQFSVSGALTMASSYKKQQQHKQQSQSREDIIFLNNCGSFEQSIYSSLSKDDDKDDDKKDNSSKDDNLDKDDFLPSPPRPTRNYHDNILQTTSPTAFSSTSSSMRHITLGNPAPANERVLSIQLMDALRGFLPPDLCHHNYWLKYDSRQHESSMTCLLTKIRASQSTIIAIRATDGTVFGSFTNTPWRMQKGWFGVGQAFLFRSFASSPSSSSSSLFHKNNKLDKNPKEVVENEYDEDTEDETQIEVYPYTGSDTYVQYCSAQIIAVGGGAWLQPEDSPYQQQEEHSHQQQMYQSNGIGLLIDGDIRGGESNSCATFCNPRLFGSTPEAGSAVGNEFFIEAMEVWTLTSSKTVKAAELTELKRLFLERHGKK